MTLKKDIAAVIKTVRALQNRDAAELAKACSLASLSRIENGSINLPLDTLQSIANALDYDLATLIVLCLANHRGESAEVALEKVRSQLLSFRSQGGHKRLRGQFDGSDLVQRSPGKPRNEAEFGAVEKLKAAGYTPSQAIKELGLPRATVYRYWKLLP